MKNFPLLSVITICLNAEKHIEQTIVSVIGQTYKNVEFIIIDGLSRDKTLNIIDKYRNHITHIVSEKDNGIADAMNKGNALAIGDFVVFLHADDYFADAHSLEEAVKYLKEDDGHTLYDILSCDILYGKNLQRMIPRGFNFWMNFKTGVYHQGVLCSRMLLERLGGFDTQFKIAMDFDFFLRCYNCGANIKYAPIVLSVMRDTGISSKTGWKELTKRFLEEYKVHKKNQTSIPFVYYWLYWVLYVPFRIMKYLIYSLEKTISESS